MSTNTCEGNQCYPHDSSGTVTELTSDADQDDLIDAVRELADIVEDQQETIEDLQETVDEQAEEIQELRADTSKERAEDRQRLTDAEERLDDLEEGQTENADPTPQTDTASSTSPETPLERTTTLPAEMVEEETANVQRAVFVASDLEDYTTSVPAGRAITAGELRRVLKAGTDARGHSQTVDRVIQVLDDLGGDEVRVVERRGERRVVFSDDITDRLKELTEQRADGDHGVVIDEVP